MQARYFTLAEARAALPQVKALMEQAQNAKRTINALRPEVWPAMRNAASNGGNVQAGELFQTYQTLEAGIKGILGMGVLVKDVESGLVDFLGRRTGREIYLCWRYGEDDIEYWHDLTAGYAGRQPIDEQVE
jgi:hypothetical protein